jgi:hypothetical protein
MYYRCSTCTLMLPAPVCSTQERWERSTDTGLTNEFGETGRILSTGRTSSNSWCRAECENVRPLRVLSVYRSAYSFALSSTVTTAELEYHAFSFSCYVSAPLRVATCCCTTVCSLNNIMLYMW